MINVKKIKQALKLLGESGIHSIFSDYNIDLNSIKYSYTDSAEYHYDTPIDKYRDDLTFRLFYLRKTFRDPVLIFFDYSKDKRFHLEISGYITPLKKWNKWILLNLQQLIQNHAMIPTDVDLLGDFNGVKTFLVKKMEYPPSRNPHLRKRRILKPFYIATNGSMYSVSVKSPEIAAKKLKKEIIKACIEKLKP